MKKIIKTNSTKRSTLLALVLLFIAPGVLALVFYKHPAWLAALPTNKGSFIRPAVQLHALDHTKKSWNMVLWCPAGCDESCGRAFDQLSRTRLALGKSLYQVELSLLQPKSATQCASDMMHLLHAQAIEPKLLSLEEQRETHVLEDEMKVILVDPRHYMVLEYSSMHKPNDVFQDLKRLLSSREQS